MTAADRTIFDLSEGLDRAGPGDRDSLGRAFVGLAPDAAVLDAGCGRGADLAALLALMPQGRVAAVDPAPAFVAHVRAAFPGLRGRGRRHGRPAGGGFDAIRSAGAVCRIGVGLWLSDPARAACCLPPERRLGRLRDNAVARAFRAEIALWRAHGGDFGYRLVVARP